jgi:hypothetical protein
MKLIIFLFFFLAVTFGLYQMKTTVKEEIKHACEPMIKKVYFPNFKTDVNLAYITRMNFQDSKLTIIIDGRPYRSLMKHTELDKYNLIIGSSIDVYYDNIGYFIMVPKAE